MARQLFEYFESDEPDPQETVNRPTNTKGEPSTSVAVRSERNARAQVKDPRIRSDLSDEFIYDDGGVRWPPNDGVLGEETPEPLLPGQIVDKYGPPTGNYLAPAGTPFEARSLPYDKSITPRQTYRVLKEFSVHKSKAAPWFGEPGGGTQFRTDSFIQDLEGTYLEHLGKSYDNR